MVLVVFLPLFRVDSVVLQLVCVDVCFLVF